MCLISVSIVCEPGTAFLSMVGIAELFWFSEKIHMASKGLGEKMMSLTKCKCICYRVERDTNWGAGGERAEEWKEKEESRK